MCKRFWLGLALASASCAQSQNEDPAAQPTERFIVLKAQGFG